MIFVSPQPNTWYAIYQRLKSHWDNEFKVGDAPPMALVLSGWTMSSDFEKQDRWKMTLRWAEQNNCSHLIRLKKMKNFVGASATRHFITK
ncbi:MAG: hypothetical protein IPO24_17240 [Bacteroidetes bacterium]|nr:hypothetical protein [Bacteroidota bacterium]